jgi:hypothetical protein
MIEGPIDEMATGTTLRKRFTTRGAKLPASRVFYAASATDHGEVPTPGRMRA